jgi:hypothetical protein
VMTCCSRAHRCRAHQRLRTTSAWSKLNVGPGNPGQLAHLPRLLA